MVQGEASTFTAATYSMPARTPEARKQGYEALKKFKQEDARNEKKQSYGAWGPIYKNKDHFASLHNC